jgi:hypothetical protein
MPDTGDDAPLGNDTPLANDVVDAGPDSGTDLSGDVPDAGKPLLVTERDQIFIHGKVGCPSVARIRVSNGGDGPTAPLKALTVAPFTIGTDACTGQTLGPGKNCDVDVKFTPTYLGTVVQPLTVVAGAQSLSITLQGSADAAGPSFSVNPLGFGSLRVSQTRTLKTSVQLSSRAADPISLSAVTVSGAEFQLTKDSCKSTTLTPGGSCELEVTFTPAATGARTATLTVLAPGACGGDQVVATPGVRHKVRSAHATSLVMPGREI